MCICTVHFRQTQCLVVQRIILQRNGCYPCIGCSRDMVIVCCAFGQFYLRVFIVVLCCYSACILLDFEIQLVRQLVLIRRTAFDLFKIIPADLETILECQLLFLMLRVIDGLIPVRCGIQHT